MTAAGIDALSEGRFMLGLGASEPQVIEGLHPDLTWKGSGKDRLRSLAFNLGVQTTLP